MDTITNFSRYLNGLNARRPADRRKSDDDLTIKLLSCFTSDINQALALDAQKELRSHMLYWDAAANGGAGGRDYAAAISGLDEIWRGMFAAGGITARAARNATGSVRAEGAMIADDSYEADEAYAATDGRRRLFTFSEMQKQRVCYNCGGLDHLASECPSSVGFRPLSHIIQILTATAAAQKASGGVGSKLKLNELV